MEEKPYIVQLRMAHSETESGYPPDWKDAFLDLSEFGVAYCRCARMGGGTIMETSIGRIHVDMDLKELEAHIIDYRQHAALGY